MRVRVLIVDDSPVMRSFIRRVLDLSGLEATCMQASDGAAALELLDGHVVDVILMDVNMPGMDGEELLQRLQQDRRFRSIPAVVISTDATARRVAGMLALGARGYVSKPFSPEALRSKLESVLESVHV